MAACAAWKNNAQFITAIFVKTYFEYCSQIPCWQGSGRRKGEYVSFRLGLLDNCSSIAKLRNASLHSEWLEWRPCHLVHDVPYPSCCRRHRRISVFLSRASSPFYLPPLLALSATYAWSRLPPCEVLLLQEDRVPQQENKYQVSPSHQSSCRRMPLDERSITTGTSDTRREGPSE